MTPVMKLAQLIHIPYYPESYSHFCENIVNNRGETLGITG